MGISYCLQHASEVFAKTKKGVALFHEFNTQRIKRLSVVNWQHKAVKICCLTVADKLDYINEYFLQIPTFS